MKATRGGGEANRTEVRNLVLRRTTFTCVTSVWNQGLNRTLNCSKNAAVRHIQLLREGCRDAKSARDI